MCVFAVEFGYWSGKLGEARTPVGKVYDGYIRLNIFIAITYRYFHSHLKDTSMSATWSCPTQSQERRRRRSLRSNVRSSSGRRRSGSLGVRQVRCRSAGPEWAGGEGKLDGWKSIFEAILDSAAK